METNIKYNLDYINECYQCITKNRKTIKDLRNDIDKDNKVIEEILMDPKLYEFVCDKLQEGIEKFELNNNKSDELYLVSKCSSCSTGGEYKEWEHKYENPDGKFNPYIDKWEFISLETNEGKYKLTVENVKGRKHILAGAYWEPDYYYTDWFEI